MVPMPSPKFKIGDNVTVKGFGSTVYRVVGCMSSIFFGENECMTEVEYDLVPQNGTTSDMVFACEEDMTLAAAPFPFIVFTFAPDATHDEDARNVRRDYENMTVDALLDMYADYALLDRTFGGRVYKRRVDAILTELRKRKGVR
ncbi:hypothetical protein M655_025080 [Brevibacillus sp. NSP2.1]|uniref:hypothetical protein n=1 Tax=Brevibacillus sp. NSP2.1 TaxID=3003229 RepID=UPI000404CA42|nr:hypothetical protein [Brevibacillus sp. NSP2.1]QHZ58644.1 hypothetical protein M655_025080 [Brevibacillus sp. NSP2.1]